MVKAVSRAQFIRGDVCGTRVQPRPPWAYADSQFSGLCTRCGECLKACPEKILVKGQGGFPQVDFNRGECTFCQACLTACQEGALSADNSPAWSVKAALEDSCLAYRGVACMTCAEQCEAEAIHFQPRIGGVPFPIIDMDTCTGCGACYKPCPSSSIRLRYTENFNPELQLQKVEA